MGCIKRINRTEVLFSWVAVGLGLPNGVPRSESPKRKRHRECTRQYRGLEKHGKEAFQKAALGLAACGNFSPYLAAK